MRYIVLLRGINISGRNKVSMEKLRNILSHEGYQDVKSYLNSGNIILSSDDEKKEIYRCKYCEEKYSSSEF